MEDQKITSIEELQKQSGPRVEELPGWTPEVPWRVKLRRVSLLGMARQGKIPNALMSAVTELYQKGAANLSTLLPAAETMEIMAKESLAEPTWEQLQEAGVSLTDEQLTAIYLYAQRGAAALAPFRADARVPKPVPDRPDVRAAAKYAAGVERPL